MNLSAFIVALFVYFMLIVSVIRNQSRKVVISNLFNIFIAIVLILSAAFRSELVGSDTPDYIEDYEAMANMSLPTVVADYYLSVVYYGSSWIARRIGLPQWCWFGLVEALYIYSALVFVNKLSKNRLFAFFCFVSIGLFFPSYCIMKQIVAMSFAMLSYIAVVEKKNRRAVSLFILGFFSHQSIILFAFAYLIYFFRKKKQLIYLLTAGFVLIAIVGGSIWSSIIGGYGNEHYMMYADSDEDYSSTAVIYMTVLLALAFIIRGSYQRKNPIECTLLISLSLFACVLQSLASSFSIAHRLAYYYMPFMVLLIPNTIESMKNVSSRLFFQYLYFAMMSFFLIYTQRSIPYLLDVKVLSWF